MGRPALILLSGSKLGSGTTSSCPRGCTQGSGGGCLRSPLTRAPPGMATYTDKLFKLRNGRWEDLLSDKVNRDVASRFAGRSVACVDRTVSRQGRVARGCPHVPAAQPAPGTSRLAWAPSPSHPCQG